MVLTPMNEKSLEFGDALLQIHDGSGHKDATFKSEDQQIDEFLNPDAKNIYTHECYRLQDNKKRSKTNPRGRPILERDEQMSRNVPRNRNILGDKFSYSYIEKYKEMPMQKLLDEEKA